MKYAELISCKIISVIENRHKRCPRCGYDFQNISDYPYLLDETGKSGPLCRNCGYILDEKDLKIGVFYLFDPENCPVIDC